MTQTIEALWIWISIWPHTHRERAHQNTRTHIDCFSPHSSRMFRDQTGALSNYCFIVSHCSIQPYQRWSGFKSTLTFKHTIEADELWQHYIVLLCASPALFLLSTLVDVHFSTLECKHPHRFMHRIVALMENLQNLQSIEPKIFWQTKPPESNLHTEKTEELPLVRWFKVFFLLHVQDSRVRSAVYKYSES